MEEKTQDTIKLDYSVKSAADRKKIVEQILQEADPKQLTASYLEILSNYIIFAMDKEEKQTKKILTDNRLVTINKRETSYQGLAGKLENGEDGIFNMTIENDKNVLLTPKISITPKDVAEIPELKELRESIEKIKELEKKATGKTKYLLKKQIIEMCQDQYVIKNSYKQPVITTNVVKNLYNLDLSENISIDEKGNVSSDGLVSLLNPKHISALLCNYDQLKGEVAGKINSDIYYLIQDLDELIKKVFKEKQPVYYDILKWKIKNIPNAQIQKLLAEKHNTSYSIEYLSSLWRNKIPKMLASQAEEDYLIWYYTTNTKMPWKKCSKCGQKKPSHNKFFSKNSTSKDGWYSVCKECRNKKQRK